MFVNYSEFNRSDVEGSERPSGLYRHLWSQARPHLCVFVPRYNPQLLCFSVSYSMSWFTCRVVFIFLIFLPRVRTWEANWFVSSPSDHKLDPIDVYLCPDTTHNCCVSLSHVVDAGVHWSGCFYSPDIPPQSMVINI